MPEEAYVGRRNIIQLTYSNFLALKWAMTEKNSDYLHGRITTMFTDNYPLTYILTTDMLDSMGHRW